MTVQSNKQCHCQYFWFEFIQRDCYCYDHQASNHTVHELLSLEGSVCVIEC